tara:strand:+ start:4606 stop:5253 length:648 start_codon:yes stop_codon:yes gene_type:complete
MNDNRAKQAKLIRDSFRELMKGVCTSIPGHVLAFDGERQMAQVQVGVERIDISNAAFTVPPIIDVPVCFPGGDFAIECQIDPGCEGLIYFSQRCIDGWIQAGGVAANPIGRFHNMQDALFLPGFRSQPNVLPDFQNNGIRLRNNAGTQFAWLKNDGSIAVENGAGHIRIAVDGTVTINGAVIGTDGDVTTATGISLDTHVHSGVQSGNSNTGAPV